MKVFCTSGGDAGEGAIFQCPMMTRFGLSTEGSTDSSVLHRRSYTISSPINGLSIPNVKHEKDFKHCLNNNNYNNNKNIESRVNFNSDNKDPEAKCPSSQTSHRLGIDSIQASERMKELYQGLNEPGDSQNSPERPPWLDIERFNQGRKFYEKYLFSIFLSDVLSLLMMFSVKRILRPLIYTDRSDTPLRALRRYLSTILHVITWYTGDVWDPEDQAHKDILKVRSIHNKSADIMNSSKNIEKMAEVNVLDKGHEEPSCPFSPMIQKDLQTQTEQGLPLESKDITTLYISQWDMSVTQYSFLGLILAHPHRMGAWFVTDKELDGLVHFWRGIGWLLGIEDKYNFCNGSLAETRALCAEMEKLVMVPSLSKSDWNHEHMSFSLIEGVNCMVPGLTFPAMFRFLADTLSLSVPTFIKHMSTQQLFRYWLMRFIFHILFLIPGVLFIFNNLLKLALRIIQNQSPSWYPKAFRPTISATPFDYT